MTALLSVLAPATAHAATIQATGGCSRYQNCDYVVNVRAAPGEENHLSMTVVDGSPVFSDPGVGLKAGRLCSNIDDHTVRCVDEVVLRVKVFAGDRDDTVDASDYAHSPVTVEGGPGNDVITGSPSRDWLNGGPGVDRISGGPGQDWVSFAGTDGRVVADLRRQTATLLGHTEHFDGVETADGGRGDDMLIGDAGANELEGGPGDDHLRGGGGDDSLAGGGGTDALRGGPGDDTLANLERNPDDIGCGSGRDTVDPADPPYVIRGDCERLYLFPLGWPPVVLSDEATILLLPRATTGGPIRLTVTVSLDGRVQRTLRRRIRRRLTFPKGSWRLPLTSPAISAARAHVAARVTVTMRARRRHGFARHARLSLLLGRIRGG
jgi:hypothetical protein